MATTARQQLEVMWRNATALLTKPLWSISPWTEAWRCCSPWELWNDFLKLNFSVNMGSVYLQHHTKENPLENTCFHNSFTLQILINVGGLTRLGRQTQIFRITAGPEEKALLETQELLYQVFIISVEPVCLKAKLPPRPSQHSWCTGLRSTTVGVRGLFAQWFPCSEPNGAVRWSSREWQ